ncbi:hypothetical protein ACLOAV_006038 [Pseudogymnoascus australis]
MRLVSAIIARLNGSHTLPEYHGCLPRQSPCSNGSLGDIGYIISNVLPHSVSTPKVIEGSGNSPHTRSSHYSDSVSVAYIILSLISSYFGGCILASNLRSCLRLPYWILSSSLFRSPSTLIPNLTSDSLSGPSSTPSSIPPTAIVTTPTSDPSPIPATSPDPPNDLPTDLPPKPPLTRANAHLFDALESHTSQQLLLTAVQVLCDDAAVLARTTPARGEQYLAIAMELVTAFFASEGEDTSEPHVAANEIFKTTRKEMERVRLELEEEEANRREDEEEGKRAVLEGRLPIRG